MLAAIYVMLGLSVVIGVGLGLANKFFFVQLDERVDQASALLPGYNCGGCGYAGCVDFAQAMVDGKVTNVSICKPCKVEKKREIIELLSGSEDAQGNQIQLEM